MDIDISKFQQVFFEDSLENINNVEKLLVKIDGNKIDKDTIEIIFRCVHSIKGSSGMFSFNNISQFTHVLENYLEDGRNGKINITPESIELLLRSFDCLRNMIDDLQQNKISDMSQKRVLEDEITKLIDNKLNKQSIELEKNEHDITPTSGKNCAVWNIFFKPDIKIFQHGDDPLRILRALMELGHVVCEVDLKNFLSVDKFYPDECYFAWNIKLKCNKTEQEIRQHAFEWVEDKSEIHFTPCEVIEGHTTENKVKTKELTSVRVSIEKVDELINMIGELVITQSTLSALSTDIKNESFKESLNNLEQKCRKLQENIMRIRMLPISNIFNRFPRMVHDLSNSSGKIIDLIMSGENTELDKMLLEKMIDPLVHLVRNAIDHGIETPTQRKSNGKNEMGTLKLNSFHQGSNIIIEVSDDGNGLDYQKITEKARKLGLLTESQVPTVDELTELIFSPGFTTAQKITDISGRGMGMDAVRKSIKSVGGSIAVNSAPGKGASFVIFLPLTLAILDGQLIRVGNSIYVIPIISMIETIQIKEKDVSTIGSDTLIFNLRGKYIPIIMLHQVFNLPMEHSSIENRFLVIVESNQQTYGIMIDELLQLQQIVIKNLDNCYGKIEGISGAAILGNHTIAFILDVTGIISLACKKDITIDLNLSTAKSVA